MAYQNTGASIRGDIAAALIQAPVADKLFIADKIFPEYGSPVKSGQYLRKRLGLGELLNDDVKARSNGSNYARTNRVFESDTYDCIEYGLEEVVDDAYANDIERFLNLETETARQLMMTLKIGYEARVAAALMNASTFTATSALVAYTEANLATINLAGDVAAAKNRLYKVGQIPNAVIMNSDVYERVRRSTLLQNQVFGVVPKTAGQVLLPGEDDIARALNVDMVLVGRAPKNGNKKGQSYSGSFIWGSTYIAVAYVAGGEFTAGGVGRTIVWNKDSQLYTIETYREEQKRGDVVRVRHSVAEKVVDSTACELITTSFA